MRPGSALTRQRLRPEAVHTCGDASSRERGLAPSQTFWPAELPQGACRRGGAGERRGGVAGHPGRGRGRTGELQVGPPGCAGARLPCGPLSCRTCCPCRGTLPRAPPTTTSRTSLTWACSRPFPSSRGRGRAAAVQRRPRGDSDADAPASGARHRRRSPQQKAPHPPCAPRHGVTQL